MARVAERLGLDLLRLALLVPCSTLLTVALWSVMMLALAVLQGGAPEDVLGGFATILFTSLFFAVMALPVTLPGALAGWLCGWLAARRLGLGRVQSAVSAGALAGLGSALALGLGAPGGGMRSAGATLGLIGGPAMLSGAICAWGLWRNTARGDDAGEAA